MQTQLAASGRAGRRTHPRDRDRARRRRRPRRCGWPCSRRAPEAADEITAALLDAPGTPRCRCGSTATTWSSTSGSPSGAPAEPPRDDGDASARISLRLSEALKADIEAAAARDGVSVNTWLVRAAGAALAPRPTGGFAGRSATPVPSRPGPPGGIHDEPTSTE